MSLYNRMKRVCLGLIIAVACAGVAAAQDTGTAQQDGTPAKMQREGQRGRPGRGREQGLMGMMRGLRELNLTEAQQQQTRAIFERFAESIKPQREALEQLRAQYEQGATAEETSEQATQLRGEIRAAMLRSRGEVVAILTPEQRAKFEQMEQERKARHEERRARRGQPQNEQ